MDNALVLYEGHRVDQILLHSKFKFRALSPYIEDRDGVYELPCQKYILTLYNGITPAKPTELEKGDNIIRLGHETYIPGTNYHSSIPWKPKVFLAYNMVH